jgi:hypothetical protein
MFGGKFNKEAFHRTFSNVKNHLSKGYHKTKEFLGNVNHGMNVAKQVYAAMAPAIEHYGGGHINKHVIKGLGAYEQMRNKVMDSHGTAANHVNQIVGQLKKGGIHIGI